MQAKQMDPIKDNNRSWWIVAVVLTSILLTAFTVYDQVFHRVSLTYIWDEQLRFHRWVIEGTSIDPWQYRILSPYLIETIRTFFDIVGLPFSYGKTFFGLRLLQNFFIFLLFAGYLSRMKVKRGLTLLGMAVLAWGFTYSGYASGLAFDTYFDVLFYLLAVILILDKRTILILPLSFVAALNRETGILVPALVMAAVFEKPLKKLIRKKEFLIGAMGLLLFVLVLIGIRVFYGPRPFLDEYTPGLSLFVFNATNLYSYFSIFATYSIVPLIALFRFKRWPVILKRYFLLTVPVWVVVHIFASVIAEARLFLVPYIVVILPAAILVIQNEDAD